MGSHRLEGYIYMYVEGDHMEPSGTLRTGHRLGIKSGPPRQCGWTLGCYKLWTVHKKL
jgi:hypothetical protein